MRGSVRFLNLLESRAMFKCPLVLVCVSLIASACTPASMLERKVEVSAAQYKDLPVPVEFRLRDSHHESHSLELGRYRFGTFEYRGSAPVTSVVSYVLERMPQHAWNLVERVGQGSDAETLVFQRDEARAEYNVHREDSRTHIKIELRTHASPIAQG